MVMQLQRSVKNVRRRPKRTNYVERVRECERGFEPHRTRGFGGFSRRPQAFFLFLFFIEQICYIRLSEVARKLI